MWTTKLYWELSWNIVLWLDETTVFTSVGMVRYKQWEFLLRNVCVKVKILRPKCEFEFSIRNARCLMFLLLSTNRFSLKQHLRFDQKELQWVLSSSAFNHNSLRVFDMQRFTWTFELKWTFLFRFLYFTEQQLTLTHCNLHFINNQHSYNSQVYTFMELITI